MPELSGASPRLRRHGLVVTIAGPLDHRHRPVARPRVRLSGLPLCGAHGTTLGKAADRHYRDESAGSTQGPLVEWHRVVTLDGPRERRLVALHLVRGHGQQAWNRLRVVPCGTKRDGLNSPPSPLHRVKTPTVGADSGAQNRNAQLPAHSRSNSLPTGRWRRCGEPCGCQPSV